jgi:hypothetical protein
MKSSLRVARILKKPEMTYLPTSPRHTERWKRYEKPAPRNFRAKSVGERNELSELL